jgi:hypothetical protein
MTHSACSWELEPGAPEGFRARLARADASSPLYNTIATLARVGARTCGAFLSTRGGLLVEYPTDREHRRDSCIFVHIWRGPEDATAEDVGLPETRVASSATNTTTSPFALFGTP